MSEGLRHHSRLAGFIIDCRDTRPDDAARFWSAALGWASRFCVVKSKAPLAGAPGVNAWK